MPQHVKLLRMHESQATTLSESWERIVQHTLSSLGFYEERRARMSLRLEQLRSTMFGEDLDLSTILLGEDDAQGEENVASAAGRLTDYVDELQKTLYACMLVYDEAGAARDEVLGRDDAWRAAGERLKRPGDMSGLDVRTLPSALSQRERDLVYAFFYCCLRASSMPGAGDLRRIMLDTANLAGHRATLPWVWPPKKLTYEDLLYSEQAETEFGCEGLDLWLPKRDDVFCLLDALCRIVRAENPWELDDQGVVSEVLARERFAGLRLEGDAIRAFYRTVENQEFLRVLTHVDLPTWLGLSPVERYARVAEDVESCDEGVLRDVVDGNYSETVDGYNYFLVALGLESRENSWNSMAHDERVKVVEDAARNRSWEEEWRVDHEEVWEAELEAQTGADVMRYQRDIRAWARETQCADELFRQFAVLRAGFFESWLPCGTGGGSFSNVELPLPRDFGELVQVAIELLLGDEGASRTMNDDLYAEIFAYLDEAKYRMDSLLLKELLRRG